METGKKKVEIVLYSAPTWHDCASLKEFLSAKGFPFINKDVAADASAGEELKTKYGRMAVPTLVIGERVFLGFRDNRVEIEKVLDSFKGDV